MLSHTGMGPETGTLPWVTRWVPCHQGSSQGWQDGQCGDWGRCTPGCETLLIVFRTVKTFGANTFFM